MDRPASGAALGQIALEWSAREPPLAPGAVAGAGAVGRALVDRAIVRVPRPRGVIAGDVVVLVGPPEALPWVDGATWLGLDPAAPSLYLPTRLAPSVFPELLARAVAARTGAGPVALLLDPPRLVPLREAAPLDPDVVARVRAP